MMTIQSKNGVQLLEASSQFHVDPALYSDRLNSRI
jgi:hypothetical protein